MNLKQLPTRIEISFWQMAVAILTKWRLFQYLVKWSFPYLVKMGAFKGFTYNFEMED